MIRPNTLKPPEATASAAWINHEDNAAKYDADEVEVIKNNIRNAAKKHDVEIEED